MAFVIIKDRPYRLGTHRSEQESNLRKEGLKTMTDEQHDKLKFLEKKVGFRRSFFDQQAIDAVK